MAVAAIVKRETLSLPRSAEPDVEIFAIGDIHGRPDLLDALLEDAAHEPRLAKRRELILLGDIVDRGPDSLEAIRLAIGARERIGADFAIALMGNHETMMRMTFDPETPRNAALEALTTWMMNGGERVVAEFCRDALAEADPDRCLAKLRRALPPFAANWLSSLRSHARSGGLLFVHAGVNPQAKLEGFLARPWNQALGALEEGRHWAWVRGPFLNHKPGPDGFSGYLVVHGHTPNDLGVAISHEEQIERFRLNLDAGSGMTGEAKMAILRDSRAEVVTARGKRNREL